MPFSCPDFGASKIGQKLFKIPGGTIIIRFRSCEGTQRLTGANTGPLRPMRRCSFSPLQYVISCAIMHSNYITGQREPGISLAAEWGERPRETVTVMPVYSAKSDTQYAAPGSLPVPGPKLLYERFTRLLLAAG